MCENIRVVWVDGVKKFPTYFSLIIFVAYSLTSRGSQLRHADNTQRDTCRHLSRHTPCYSFSPNWSQKPKFPNLTRLLFLDFRRVLVSVFNDSVFAITASRGCGVPITRPWHLHVICHVTLPIVLSLRYWTCLLLSRLTCRLLPHCFHAKLLCDFVKGMQRVCTVHFSMLQD